jgi:hypothetical protein
MENRNISHIKEPLFTNEEMENRNISHIKALLFTNDAGEEVFTLRDPKLVRFLLENSILLRTLNPDEAVNGVLTIPKADDFVSPSIQKMLLKQDITVRNNGSLQIGNANSTVTPSELEQAVEYFSSFFNISPKTSSILFGRYEPFFPTPQAAQKINSIVKYRAVFPPEIIKSNR